jgi:hypothetical protein
MKWSFEDISGDIEHPVKPEDTDDAPDKRNDPKSMLPVTIKKAVETPKDNHEEDDEGDQAAEKRAAYESAKPGINNLKGCPSLYHAQAFLGSENHR